MSLLQGLQNMLGNRSVGQPGGGTGTGIFDGLAGLFGGPTNQGEASSGVASAFSRAMSGQNGLMGPTALGGLLGALLSSGAARNIAGGALLAGGGAALWNKYKNRMREEDAQSDNPKYAQSATTPPHSDFATGMNAAAGYDLNQRSLRLVRALVFAARADGHIDEQEESAIRDELQKLNLGEDADRAVKQAMADPLDPKLIAQGVSNEEEALELFTVSSAVINPDQYMEKAYLDGLAKALNIPNDVRDDITRKVHTGQ